jgi:hypothetical protein
LNDVAVSWVENESESTFSPANRRVYVTIFKLYVYLCSVCNQA